MVFRFIEVSKPVPDTTHPAKPLLMRIILGWAIKLFLWPPKNPIKARKKLRKYIKSSSLNSFVLQKIPLSPLLKKPKPYTLLLKKEGKQKARKRRKDTLSCRVSENSKAR